MSIKAEIIVIYGFYGGRKLNEGIKLVGQFGESEEGN